MEEETGMEELEGERESRIRKEGGWMKWLEESEKIWRIFDGEVINVANNAIGTVHNAPLSYAPGKEFHPLILVKPEIHGGQVKLERR